MEPETKGKFRFPSAFTVLVIVALAVWALALIIPSGQYRLKEGAPVPGTYHTVPSPQNFGARLSDLLLSPVNGLYGIQDTKTSAVGPDKTGALFGGAEVFLFVLAIGRLHHGVDSSGRRNTMGELCRSDGGGCVEGKRDSSAVSVGVAG